jgi:hypothetical protein
MRGQTSIHKRNRPVFMRGADQFHREGKRVFMERQEGRETSIYERIDQYS